MISPAKLKFYWDMIQLVKRETISTNEEVLRFKSDDDEAMLITMNGVRYVVFDGTDSPREWLENLMTWKTTDADTHYGFENAAREFFANISQFLDGGSINHVIGFSRGGAIAQRFAQMARNALYRVDVTTFGAPKLGGRRFCEKMNGIQHTRVVIDGDPVPLLPLSSVKWKHYENELVRLKRPGGVRRPTQVHTSYGKVLSDLLK